MRLPALFLAACLAVAAAPGSAQELFGGVHAHAVATPLSLNDGPDRRVDADGTHTELGSRVLFEPELALGTQLSERVSLEASWVHISGARLFNTAQNPGIDMIGVRVNWRL